MRTFLKRALLAPFALAAALGAAACEDGTGLGEGEVAIRFRSAGQAGQASLGPAAVDASQALTVEGTNGVLTITDVRLIVEEFELEGDDDACEREDDDDCAEFESGPFFVQLPVDAGGVVTITQDAIRPGTYDELEFEVEDLEDDEDDEDAAAIAALRAQIRSEFPEWPDRASALVVGTFTPVGGAPQPFSVFIEAEIEVEMELNPPLVVPGDRALVIDVAPGFWFRRPDGSVLDLTQWDHATTGRLLELELEFEDGFVELEIDD
ncbi:MAG: hypothetical protein ACRELD_12135 [Longimicrobiales bacterium]